MEEAPERKKAKYTDLSAGAEDGRHNVYTLKVAAEALTSSPSAEL